MQDRPGWDMTLKQNSFIKSTAHTVKLQLKEELSLGSQLREPNDSPLALGSH